MQVVLNVSRVRDIWLSLRPQNTHDILLLLGLYRGFIGIIRYILGLYRDCRVYIGDWDYRVDVGVIGILEKKMETTI